MIESSPVRNHRIAKNTIFLYLRTIIMTAISLFTSRLTLEALGIDNYGIYNVVGGFVGLMSFVSGSISGSISRFITFGLGKGNDKQLKVIFSTSVNVQLAISFIILIMGETIGIWFVSNELNLPPDNSVIANWVLQCSLITFVASMLTVPYSACIVAHEKMAVFAYMTIIDVSLKLIFVYTLFITPFNVLITYASALSIVSILNVGIYYLYCIRHFKECRYEAILDKKLLKEMSGFAGWSFLGNTAYLFNTQGVNIIINLYFGVTLNAARGIVTQVTGAIMTFINNFTMAFNPQITKSFAEGNQPYLFSLICRGAKFSFFLLLLVLIPVEIETPYLLGLWLKEVPPFTSSFLRLQLLCDSILVIGTSGYTAIMATGNIRNYQIAVTIVGCLVFPITWIAYYFGAPAIVTYLIFIPIYICLIIIRLKFLKKLLQFPLSEFLYTTLLPIGKVCFLAIPIPLLLSLNMVDNFMRLVVITLVSLICTSFTIYMCGLSTREREIIRLKLQCILTEKILHKK